MSSAPRVLVVENDGWVLKLLSDGLREGGFVVTTETTADAGFARARELDPDALLCDVTLPGRDGYSLAIMLRAESIVPIAMLAHEADKNARIAAFEAGADALITRPFKIDEVVAQMTALVQLASRMRHRRTSLVDSLRAGPPSTTFRGDLAHMPVASLLVLLEIEKKSGAVVVKSDRGEATLQLASGAISAATLGDLREPVAVLRELLEWTEGRIEFRVDAATPRPPGARAIRLLLAQAGHQPIAELSPTPATSPSRTPAMRPPPGKRVSAADFKAVKAPALVEQDTRRVDVPSIPPRNDDPKD
jgi:DNA-binding response OmpR family regulator